MSLDNLTQIWKQVLQDVDKLNSGMVVKTWLKESRLLSISQNQAEITVRNTANISFVKKYAESEIKQRLSDYLNQPITTIQYTIAPTSTEEKPRRRITNTTESQISFTGNSQNQENPKIASNLNPKYLFSNFIVGNRNRLAYAAAKAVAEQPGMVYNPLYLYGGVGLGKTHLMQAVGNEIIQHDPSKQVLYVSCEGFTNEYVASIRRNKPEDFKRKYRSVDVFLMDDIQFMAGKDGTQEEFFHTFNALYQMNKQIIITSDKVPAEIKDLEERLSSRFNSGMIADIQPPDFETRQAILQAKCQERNISLNNDLVSIIAEEVESNIRELEGALTHVYLCLQSSGKFTAEETRLALMKISAKKPAKKSSFEIIAQIVSDYYKVPLTDIKGPCRQKELVKPRQVLMYLLKHELGMTFPSIGREIGGRDHTTAMHAVDKIEKEMKKSPDLLEELQSIKEHYYIKGNK